jgi:hypothetical protein
MMSELTQAEMAVAIGTGRGEMPAFEELSQAEIWSLTAYLRTLSFASELETIPQDSSDTGTTVGLEPTPTSGTEAESPPDNQGTGTIIVDVFNTSSSSLPSVDITLRGYDEMTEVYSQTLTLSEGTQVTFEAVPLPLDRMYFASMEHENAVFGSDILVIEPTSPSDLNLDINYYQPTNDPAILQVDRLHIFFSFASQETLEIYQLYIFSNPTNMVLTPKEGLETAVDFTIPPNASNLYVEDNMSMAYRKTDQGFGIVNVYPDENAYQTVFSYQVPYDEQKLDLAIPIGMDAGAVIVMTPTDGLKVRSDQLIDAGMRDIQGVSYNMFTGSDLSAGSTLELSLSGAPKQTTQFITTDTDSNNSLVIGLAGFGVALIAAGVFIWLRNRADQAGWEQEDEEEAYYEEDTPEDLMDAIIALDDQFRASGISEEPYRVRRAELKQRLKELLAADN